MDIRGFDPRDLPRGRKTHLTLDVTTMADGNPLHFDLLAAVGAEPGPTVVVLAGVHGDEYEGMLAIPAAFEQIEPTRMRGRVLCVPVCNVPAYLAATRTSPIDGLNLARVFPGDPNGTITQRVAYWLGQRILLHADLMIDLHSAGTSGFHLPTLCGYYHHDSPAGHRSREVAMAFGAEVVWGHPTVAAGRTTTFCTENEIPWVYTEAPGAGRVRPADLETFTRGVLNGLKVMGVIDGQTDGAEPRYHLVGSGDLDQSIAANVGGLLVNRVDVLQTVERGDVLGEIRDVAGRTIETVEAPEAGVVISVRGLPRVNPGDDIYLLTQRAAENE